jgi:hypothetical protein
MNSTSLEQNSMWEKINDVHNEWGFADKHRSIRITVEPVHAGNESLW